MPGRVVLACLLIHGLASGCKSKTDEGAATHSVRSTDLLVPDLPDWTRDRGAEADDPKQGGVLLRLVRPGNVPGSPRIDVIVTPEGTQALSIDEFLQKNLREMATLEAQGQIRITQVEQRPVAVGVRRGYRVRHEYLLAGGTISITQVAELLVLDGRGVAVTAVGRTELFAPLADAIERVLNGLQIAAPASTPTNPGALSQPIDLGKVGK